MYAAAAAAWSPSSLPLHTPGRPAPVCDGRAGHGNGAIFQLVRSGSARDRGDDGLVGMTGGVGDFYLLSLASPSR